MIQDHFDSSIIAEIWTDKPKSKQSKEKCQQYLYTVLTKYKSARFTLLNLGELKKVIMYKVRESQSKLNALETVKHWLENGIDLCSPQFEAFQIALELKEVMGWGAEPMDMLHIATAIEKKARRFVTLEENILQREAFIQTVKDRYDLKIVPP